MRTCARVGDRMPVWALQRECAENSNAFVCDIMISYETVDALPSQPDVTAVSLSGAGGAGR